ncbi:hypothetical protein B0H14DRAFT_3132929 [Mycena olivaceomarginata]|nr:hypothetical protein B0H14DRAFT_3132929 [Mycena olivaceomarginata]
MSLFPFQPQKIRENKYYASPSSLALLTRLSAFSRSALLLWIGALARVRAPNFKFMKTMRILFPIQKDSNDLKDRIAPGKTRGVGATTFYSILRATILTAEFPEQFGWNTTCGVYPNYATASNFFFLTWGGFWPRVGPPFDPGAGRGHCEEFTKRFTITEGRRKTRSVERFGRGMLGIFRSQFRTTLAKRPMLKI